MSIDLGGQLHEQDARGKPQLYEGREMRIGGGGGDDTYRTRRKQSRGSGTGLSGELGKGAIGHNNSCVRHESPSGIFSVGDSCCFGS